MSKAYDKASLSSFSIELEKVQFSSKKDGYRNNPAVNQSYLKAINNVSPSHAEYLRLNPEETPALVFGSALHTMVLEPFKFNERYAVLPECDRRTKEGKAVYEAFCFDNAGKTVLKTEDYLKLKSMAAKSIGYFEDKHSDSTYAEAELYGNFVVTSGDFMGERISVKAQLDILHERKDKIIIKDLKSVADISNVSGASYHSGWATQSAFYCDLAAFCFRKPTEFEYIAQSKDEPYDVRLFGVSDEMIIKGRNAYTSALHKWLCWKANGKPDTADFIGKEVLNG